MLDQALEGLREPGLRLGERGVQSLRYVMHSLLVAGPWIRRLEDREEIQQGEEEESESESIVGQVHVRPQGPSAPGL